MMISWRKVSQILWIKIKGVVFQKNSFHRLQKAFCGRNEGWSFSLVMKMDTMRYVFNRWFIPPLSILMRLSLSFSSENAGYKAAVKLLVL